MQHYFMPQTREIPAVSMIIPVMQHFEIVLHNAILFQDSTFTRNDENAVSERLAHKLLDRTTKSINILAGRLKVRAEGKSN